MLFCNCLCSFCLILQLQNESLGLPVMVYIHGGSFRVGSAQEFWPNYLLERDVVLVVPQYRLGPLGELVLLSAFGYLTLKVVDLNQHSR